MRTKGEQLSQLVATAFPTLTRAETTLLQKAAFGTIAYCGCQPEEESPEEANDPRNSEAWGEERTIHAALIRWLCIDLKARSLIDPKGLRIKFAKIDGILDLSSITIPFPLVLLRCSIPKGIDVSYATSCFLNFEGSTSGPVKGNGLVVSGNLFLRKGFQAKGGVELEGAKITGRLDCTGGRFLNLCGKALDAGSIDVGQHILLRRERGRHVLPRQEFRAKGAVWLVGATIGGYLSCTGGTFYNPGKTALAADGSTVGGPAFLNDGFRVEGLVHLNSSKFNGNLSFRRAQFHGEAPYRGLIAQDIEVTGLFDWREVNKLDPKTSQTHNTKAQRMVPDHSIGLPIRLDLRGARVGRLADDVASWPAAGNLDLGNFTYTAIDEGQMDAKTRRKWVERQTSVSLDPLVRPQAKRPSYSAKPYQQLAKVLRESGHEADAKQILIFKEKARRKRGNLGPIAKCWNGFLGLTMAHGYRPQQLLLFALGFVLLGAWLFGAGYQAGIIIPAKSEAYTIYEKTGQMPVFYPAFSRFMYSLDIFLPIINFGQKDYWGPRDLDNLASVRQQLCLGYLVSVVGPPPSLCPQSVGSLGVISDSLLYVYRWIHIGVGWLLITLGIAGVTNLVRKE
jgi:hypothetical protein